MKNTRCVFKTASSFESRRKTDNDITAKGKTQEDFACGQKG